MSHDFTSVAQVVALTGYAFIRDPDGSRTSIDAARSLGDVDEVEGLDQVQELIPRASDYAAPNTYSGTFGLAEFPLHTDLAHWARPPRYLMLRCVRGAPDIFTRVLDGQLLISEIGVERLRMTLVKPRRPMRNGKQLLRLLDRSDNGKRHIFRWDSIYLKAASATAMEVCESAAAFLVSARPVEVALLEPGDTMVIDNWRCLHGRSSATDEVRGRQIDRVYLKELQ